MNPVVARMGLFMAIGFCFVSPVRANLSMTPLSSRLANYDIDVRLDSEKKMLFGSQKLIWHNASKDFIKELQFHLYLNAFRNNRSTFMQETHHHWNDFKQDNWGYININRITTKDGIDLGNSLCFIHPDDDNADDQTVCRVLLPKRLPPNGVIELLIDFEAKLPEPPISRNGAKEEYIMAAQWFPKIGVWEAGKWNCHQYHSHGEFYADYGVYNVRITVPATYIVGATGMETSWRQNEDGTITHFYHAEDVHDFAWAASPDFVEFTDRAQDVVIRVLMQKDHIGQSERYLQAAKAAVAYFQDSYGDYPFPNLTVIDPRRGASETGGMEYPTLITAGTYYGMPAGLHIPELLIMHEFGHNYWYHLTANNEFEEAWLDEGINTYSEMQIFNDLYGVDGNTIDLVGLRLSNLHFYRLGYIGLPDRDPIVRNSWEFHPGGSYSRLVYYKAGLALATLHNYLGKETMRQIMQTFLQQYRFRHPHSKDFIAVANAVSGKNLNWFFDQALYSNAVLDYAVTHISSRTFDEKMGYDYTISTADSVMRKSTATDSFAPKSAAAEKIFKNTVRVERLGSFIFPVELKVTFADGDTIRQSWEGRELWKNFVYVRKTKVVSATVDPDNKILLDVNLTNNSRTLQPQSVGIIKWTARCLFGIQFFLDLPELFLALLSRLIA